MRVARDICLVSNKTVRVLRSCELGRYIFSTTLDHHSLLNTIVEDYTLSELALTPYVVVCHLSNRAANAYACAS